MTTGAPELKFLIQRRKGDGWQDVATREGYDCAKETAKAWTLLQGVEHRVVDDLGQAITPVDFQPLSDAEYREVWRGILQGPKGLTEQMAAAGAQLYVDERRREAQAGAA